MDAVGNYLCLDFANTVNKRPEPDRDDLATLEGLLTWADNAGISRTGADLAEAVELREAVYRTFSAVAAHRPPPPEDTATIMDLYGTAVRLAELHREGDKHVLRWRESRIVWPIAVSAAHLLLNGPLDRVGECPSCRWLFLDTSRNGRRRWCSMAVCGSRVKARRHYASKQGG